MKCILTFITLCAVGINAIPRPVIQGRVGGGVIAENAPHACMVLVHRQSLAPGDVVLGGGSIVSTRRVLTAAHLVQGTNRLYQVGFFVLTRRRMADSTFAVIHQDFDSSTYHSDIALIFFTKDIFPVANIIPISSNAAQPAPGSRATLVGFGFIYHHSNTASLTPYAALQNIANSCALSGFVTGATHVCGVDNTGTSTFGCPGDNGSGLYIVDENNAKILVGVASRVDTFCDVSSQTAYTRVSTFSVWINNLL